MVDRMIFGVHADTLFCTIKTLYKQTFIPQGLELTADTHYKGLNIQICHQCDCHTHTHTRVHIQTHYHYTTLRATKQIYPITAWK